MKIGSQMFSLRLQCKTPEDLRETLIKVKEMGYDLIQASGKGIVETDAYLLRDLTQELGLEVPLTHFPNKRLEEELDEVIAWHKTVGIPVVGLGAMPKPLRDGKVETLLGFMKQYDTIAKKLEDAGLRFAYHNHNFEFDPLDNGRCMFDYLAEECSWDIIADVCWIHVAGRNVPEELNRVKGRLYNGHLKDVRPFTAEQKQRVLDDPEQSIAVAQENFCPLGQGEVDLVTAAAALEACGCVNAFVEQDNASSMPDPLGEMRRSAEYLRSIGLLK